MKTQLKYAALAGCVGLVCLGLSQVPVVGRSSSGQKFVGMSTQSGGIASKAPSGLQVQTAIRRFNGAYSNSYYYKAKAAGDHELASKMIEVNCYHTLAVMTPGQQQYEIDHVWELGKYKPDGSWSHVASAPSKIKVLLSIDPAKDKKIEAIANSVHAEVMAKYSQAYKEAHAAAKSQSNDAREIRIIADRIYKDKVKVINAAKKTTPYQDWLPAVAKIRALLTPAERAEWDMLTAQSKRDNDTVFNNRNAKFGY